MKRQLFTLLILVGLVLAVLTWPISKPDSQLAADGGYEGNAQCEACEASVNAEYQQCIAIYGEGDAECNGKREDGLALCRAQYCIMSARADSGLLDKILPTAKCANLAAPLKTIPAPTSFAAAVNGKCDEGGDYYEACSGVGLTTWDTCRAAGGSKQQCELDAQQSQNNCMRDFGCPPILF